MLSCFYCYFTRATFITGRWFGGARVAQRLSISSKQYNSPDKVYRSSLQATGSTSSWRQLDYPLTASRCSPKIPTELKVEILLHALHVDNKTFLAISATDKKLLAIGRYLEHNEAEQELRKELGADWRRRFVLARLFIALKDNKTSTDALSEEQAAAIIHKVLDDISSRGHGLRLRDVPVARKVHWFIHDYSNELASWIEVTQVGDLSLRYVWTAILTTAPCVLRANSNYAPPTTPIFINALTFAFNVDQIPTLSFNHWIWSEIPYECLQRSSRNMVTSEANDYLMALEQLEYNRFSFSERFRVAFALKALVFGINEEEQMMVDKIWGDLMAEVGMAA